MGIAKKLKRILLDKDHRFLAMAKRGLFNRMSDEKYLRKMFRAYMGYDLDLDDPKTFNEKLQWLKLHDRKPIYTKMVDKYEVKKLISEKIGKEYIIPTLGVYKSADEIDFNKLPEKFVLKCTHDSHGLVICKDKSKLDINAAKKKLDKALKSNYYYKFREWPYKNVKPRIIAEKYMEDKLTGELRDYKFFAFNGCVKALYIASERQSAGAETKFDFFDTDFNHLPFKNGHPNAKVPPEKPKGFKEMIRLAEKLSVGIPHVRVDFYEINGRIYFGELTFFHWSGMKKFEPKKWDRIFGSWIDLPYKNKR